DRVHDEITRSVKNARPPHFEFEWKDPRTLIIVYKSKRGMIDFAVGLLRGVGRFYKEDIRVKKLPDDRIEVVVP
ncbi:MAG TPA: heme NO-binding domain-containing protein, partial [bacterium]|nr:heme NO-binding domain-containing protein [bacterium]